jgi:hypothetical protein
MILHVELFSYSKVAVVESAELSESGKARLLQIRKEAEALEKKIRDTFIDRFFGKQCDEVSVPPGTTVN